MTHYILQVIVFQLLFLAVYLLWLKKETFFNYNRIYLLGTALVSFGLPFLQFDSINEQISSVFRMQLPAVFLGGVLQEDGQIIEGLDPVFITQSTSNWSAIILGIYLLGVVVTIFLFVLKLQKLARLRTAGAFISIPGYRLCILPDSTHAFTFLRTMYLGDKISETEKDHIIAHEKVHIDQGHSLDLLFFEGLKIVFWFNPMVYVFQRHLKTLHEFAADYTVAKEDKSEYYQKLLSQVFGTTTISFINTFFNHSLIKKRIIMLQKSKSNRVSALKYLLVVPFIAGMLVYTSCTQDTSIVTDSDLSSRIANLTSDIVNKENLSEEEKAEIAKMILKVYPKDVKGISSKDRRVSEMSNEEYWDKVNSGEEIIEVENVPFAIIDKAPIYPGCETQIDHKASKRCLSDAITKHVQGNFNTKLADNIGLSGRQRISIQFKIDKTGTVTDVIARAPHPSLEAEAIRVVNDLPQMIPGEQNNEKVGVLYNLPIIFQVNE